MKSASPALINLLATRQFYSADLYNFSLIGGSQLNYCGGDRDVIWNSITWSSGASTGPYFDRKDNKAKCHWKVGVEVDTLVFDVLPGPATVGDQPFLSFARWGGFDGAELVLYRAFMPTYGNVSDGVVTMFAGRVAQIDASRSLATFSVNSHLELLNMNLPRNIFQATCNNTLYDAGCALVKSSLGVSGTVDATGTLPSQVNTTSLSQATGYFSLGEVLFTSGQLAGFSRTVKAYTHGTPSNLALISPFPVTPAGGDAFTVYPGCDKLQGTCNTKFNNVHNFRGFPSIPGVETAA